MPSEARLGDAPGDTIGRRSTLILIAAGASVGPLWALLSPVSAGASGGGGPAR